MPISGAQPIWQLVGDFVKSNARPTTLKEIAAHLLANGRNPSNAGPDTSCISVNSNSRVHYASGKQPRRTDSGNRYDLLYRLDDGTYVEYDPAQHGVWEIFRSNDGTLGVRCITEPSLAEFDGTENDAAGSDTFQGSSTFRLESHLRDYLAQNLGLIQGIGTSLTLYQGESNKVGVEYPTEVGPIDILAVGADGAFYVIELKVGRGPDAAVGQTLRYIAAIRNSLAQGKPVYGVIVASEITDKLRYAVSEVSNRIFVAQYELKVTLKPVDVILNSGSR